MINGDLRITRAFLATYVLALLTFGLTGHEQCLAPMTSATDPLFHWLPNQILTTSTRRDGQHHLVLGRRLLEGFLSRNGCTSTCTSLAFFLTFLLRFGGWVTEALLATKMLTAWTDLVCAERSETAMAVTTNTHTDRSLDPVDSSIA